MATPTYSEILQAIKSRVRAAVTSLETTMEDYSLDKLMSVADGTGAYPESAADDSVVAKMLAKGNPAAITTYDNTTDSQEAIADNVGNASSDTLTSVNAKIGNTATTLDARLTAVEALMPASVIAAATDVTGAHSTTDGKVDDVQTDINKAVFCVEFWSIMDNGVTISSTPADIVLPSITIAAGGIPSGSTILRASCMFKARLVNNGYAGANKLAGVQKIQVKENAAGTFTDCVYFDDDCLYCPAQAVYNGATFDGSYDVKAEVAAANKTYAFQWNDGVTDQDSISLYDIQTGIRVWFTV